MRPAQNHSFVLVGILIGFYWLLVIGYWLLVTGYWLLVIGYWLLLDTGLFWLFNRTGYLIVLVIESPIQSTELTKIRRSFLKKGIRSFQLLTGLKIFRRHL